MYTFRVSELSELYGATDGIEVWTIDGQFRGVFNLVDIISWFC